MIVTFCYFQVPSISLVNKEEPVLWGNSRGWSLDLGASFSTIRSHCQELASIYGTFTPRYLLHADRQKRRFTAILHHDATVEDQLQACVHAELFAFVEKHGFDAVHEPLRKEMLFDRIPEDDVSLMRCTYLACKQMFLGLVEGMKGQGWRPDLCLLAADEWRANWDFSVSTSSKED
jgi:hypothetical protein